MNTSQGRRAGAVRHPSIEILGVADCPNVAAAARRVARCLDRLGLAIAVEHRIGDFPSPTVLVDGVDVTSAPVSAVAACRLDLPTEQMIATAIERAAGIDVSARHP
ncbi:alkylmercury lyase [Nocardia rhizosphaerae]|uniref:Alkylmercury lyase n=1 Tax=Nocardia rhizosphaerae TaxID=1691571 RepID=A0ABV8L624_9NOCA